MTENKIICDYEGIKVTWEHLKNLISKDRFMNDKIINAYLYILTNQEREVYCMPTFVFQHLQDEAYGWKGMHHFFHNKKSRTKHPTKCKPPKNASVIIIPINLNNIHWVTVVQKQNGKETKIFFIDNLYNEAMENTVKQQFEINNPDEWLNPLGTSWVTYTAIPHKKECGPRALLHGTNIALHQDPNEDMLEHFKHQDLAKISRDLIAKLVVSGRLHMDALQDICMSIGQDEVLEEGVYSEGKKDDEADGMEKGNLMPERNKEENRGMRNGEKQDMLNQEMDMTEIKETEREGQAEGGRQLPKRSRSSMLGHQK